MKMAILTFERVVQDSQDYGSDEQHMVSRVFLSLEIDGSKTENLYVDVKQTVGSDFETSPLEVSRPAGYKGPLNYPVFRDEVERFYREMVGKNARGIRTGPNTRLRMRNNTFTPKVIVHYPVDEEQSTGW